MEDETAVLLAELSLLLTDEIPHLLTLTKENLEFSSTLLSPKGPRAHTRTHTHTPLSLIRLIPPHV